MLGDTRCQQRKVNKGRFNLDHGPDCQVLGTDECRILWVSVSTTHRISPHSQGHVLHLPVYSREGSTNGIILNDNLVDASSMVAHPPLPNQWVVKSSAKYCTNLIVDIASILQAGPDYSKRIIVGEVSGEIKGLATPNLTYTVSKRPWHNDLEQPLLTLLCTASGKKNEGEKHPCTPCNRLHIPAFRLYPWRGPRHVYHPEIGWSGRPNINGER